MSLKQQFYSQNTTKFDSTLSFFSDKSRFSNAVYFSLHLLVRTNKQLQLNKICFSVRVVLIHYMTGAVAGDSWNHAKTCQFYFRVALATSLKLVTCWHLSQTLSELQQRSFEGSKFTKDSCACEIQCTMYLFIVRFQRFKKMSIKKFCLAPAITGRFWKFFRRKLVPDFWSTMG